MSLFKSKYRIEPARLDGYDYGSHGLYYITICTKNRMHYFGEVIETDNAKDADNNAKEIQLCVSFLCRNVSMHAFVCSL